MAKRTLDRLSRRERQIMELIYAAGQATATEVLERLPDPPSYSTVRALLRILETKGHLRHVVDGTRYVFLPTLAPERARRSAMQSLLQTFFEGSPEKAVAALLDVSRSELSEEDLDRISRLIENAREEGR
jgi:BlaI family transcriptional regulator, penicillinase repressor